MLQYDIRVTVNELDATDRPNPEFDWRPEEEEKLQKELIRLIEAKQFAVLPHWFSVSYDPKDNFDLKLGKNYRMFIYHVSIVERVK